MKVYICKKCTMKVKRIECKYARNSSFYVTYLMSFIA